MEFKRYKGYSPDELRKKPVGPVASNTPDYLNKLEKEKELLRKEKELTLFLDSLNN